MKLVKLITVLFISISIVQSGYAQEETKNTKKNVRYTKGKKLDFESILIKGHLKRPEMSVVTGDVNGEDEGLLKLREDFLDHMAVDLGVEVQ